MACSNCSTHCPYYKLYRSDRADHIKYDDEGKAFHKILCQDCEHHFRIIEVSDWSKRPENERNDDPDYASYDRVRRDLRKQARGENWFQSGVAMKLAKAALKEEAAMGTSMPQINQAVSVDGNSAVSSMDGAMDVDAQSTTTSASSRSRKERRTWVMKKSKSIAEGLVNALLKCNMTHGSFEEAGERMIATAEALEILEHYEAALERATEPAAIVKIHEEIDRATADVADQATYRTASNHGLDQGAFLKALDFADEVGPDIRMCNVCTQPDDVHGKCGYAVPSKLWWQKGRGTRFWEFAVGPSDDDCEVVGFQMSL